MRTPAFLILALMLLAAQPSSAQETESEHLAAATELFESVSSDPRLLSMMEDRVRRRIPELHAAIANSEQYASYSPKHQQAVLVAIETIPSVLVSEYRRALAPIAASTAPRFAALMSTDELWATVSVIRSDDTEALFSSRVQDIFEGHPSESAFPDLSQTESGRRFLATRAGQTFLEKQSQLDQILAEETIALERNRPSFRLIGMRMVCDALEEQCPPWTRQQLGRD